MRLLEEYSVGQTLGEGAFGVVSNCKHRVSGIEYAVKMVDKVETPVDQIKKEAALLKSLNHSNIVKVHGVYYERCFVCIVMDKYSGGDLVEGLQKHLKERGQINCHHVVGVARQMGASIQFLHQNNVVHRDVKGDNYLMDRRDITDPQCKVVLTDFGTACHVSDGERLSAAVGTKIFWSPEFFDKSYSVKVDVWAMGVVMHGLVTGRFPFRDEADIRAKEVKIPKRVHPVCEEFTKKMLEKKEALRFSSDQVMAHAWVNDSSSSTKGAAANGAAAAEHEGEEGNTGMMEGDAANDGIKERRQELINRLNKEHENRGSGAKTSSGAAKSSGHAEKSSFTLKDKAGNRMVFEWWDKAKQSGLLDTECKTAVTLALKDQGEPGDINLFKTMLEEHNIDTSKFGVGKAKPLEGLSGEIDGGAARLMLDATEHKKLVRVCDLVVLILRNADGSRTLIESAEKFPDGRTRPTMRLPGTKKEPYENTKQVAERVMKEFLRIDPAGVKLDLTRIERVEEEAESVSYPGVVSVYRKEIVEGFISMTDSAALAKIGLPSNAAWEATDDKSNTKIFNWMTPAQLDEKNVKLRPQTQEVSALVRAPIGLNEEALKSHLTTGGIDVSKFGQPGMKSLREFSAELIKGESTLTQDKAGQLVRVVDVVVLIITRGDGQELLVQTEQVHANGDKTTLNRLPGAKRRPDENHFLSARRIIRRQLEISENTVIFQTDVQSVEEEKPSPQYPGLKTVYRKRLIRGVMQKAS
jgi:serine/threonine protein kinase